MNVAPTNVNAPGTLREAVLNAIRALWLDRRDPWHVTDHLPYSLICLHQEQLAYDVIKWYAVNLMAGCQRCFLGTPLFNISNADRSEEVLPLLGDEELERECPLSFHYLLPLLLLKARLVEHLVNVNRFYQFIAVVNKLNDMHISGSAATVVSIDSGQSEQQDANHIAGAVLSKFAGNAIVLHHIKSYLLDPQHLPTSKFAVHDMDSMLRQMIALIQLMTDLNPKIWLSVFLPELMYGKNWKEKHDEIGNRRYRKWTSDELGLMTRLYVDLFDSFPNESNTIMRMVCALYERGGRNMHALNDEQKVYWAKKVAEAPIEEKENLAEGVVRNREGKVVSLFEVL
jgi:hypothetical protein